MRKMAIYFRMSEFQVIIKANYFTLVGENVTPRVNIGLTFGFAGTVDKIKVKI